MNPKISEESKESINISGKNRTKKLIDLGGHGEIRKQGRIGLIIMHGERRCEMILAN